MKKKNIFFFKNKIHRLKKKTFFSNTMCASRVHFVRPLAIFLALSSHSSDKTIAMPIARQGTRLRSMTSVTSLLGDSFSVDLHPSPPAFSGFDDQSHSSLYIDRGRLGGPVNPKNPRGD